MASDKPDEPRERLVIADTAAEQHRDFLRGMEALKLNPIDRAKRPGGYYLNADGSGAHDSEGLPVPLRAEDETLCARLRADQARRLPAPAKSVGHAEDAES